MQVCLTNALMLPFDCQWWNCHRYSKTNQGILVIYDENWKRKRQEISRPMWIQNKWSSH